MNDTVIEYFKSIESIFDLLSVCDEIPDGVSEQCKEQFLESCNNKSVLFSSKCFFWSIHLLKNIVLRNSERIIKFSKIIAEYVEH